MGDHLLSRPPQAALEKVVGTCINQHRPLPRASPLQQVGQRRHFILFAMQQQAIRRHRQWLAISPARYITYRQPQQRHCLQLAFKRTGHTGEHIGTKRKPDQATGSAGNSRLK